MLENNYLVIDNSKKRLLRKLFDTTIKTIYKYSCKFNIKYKNIFGTTSVKSIVYSNNKINDFDNKQILEDNYLKIHPEVEKANLLSFFQISKEKIT